MSGRAVSKFLVSVLGRFCCQRKGICRLVPKKYEREGIKLSGRSVRRNRKSVEMMSMALKRFIEGRERRRAENRMYQRNYLDVEVNEQCPADRLIDKIVISFLKESTLRVYPSKKAAWLAKGGKVLTEVEYEVDDRKFEPIDLLEVPSEGTEYQPPPWIKTALEDPNSNMEEYQSNVNPISQEAQDEFLYSCAEEDPRPPLPENPWEEEEEVAEEKVPGGMEYERDYERNTPSEEREGLGASRVQATEVTPEFFHLLVNPFSEPGARQEWVPSSEGLSFLNPFSDDPTQKTTMKQFSENKPQDQKVDPFSDEDDKQCSAQEVKTDTPPEPAITHQLVFTLMNGNIVERVPVVQEVEEIICFPDEGEKELPDWADDRALFSAKSENGWEKLEDDSPEVTLDQVLALLEDILTKKRQQATKRYCHIKSLKDKEESVVNAVEVGYGNSSVFPLEDKDQKNDGTSILQDPYAYPALEDDDLLFQDPLQTTILNSSEWPDTLFDTRE